MKNNNGVMIALIVCLMISLVSAVMMWNMKKDIEQLQLTVSSQGNNQVLVSPTPSYSPNNTNESNWISDLVIGLVTDEEGLYTYKATFQLLDYIEGSEVTVHVKMPGHADYESFIANQVIVGSFEAEFGTPTPILPLLDFNVAQSSDLDQTNNSDYMGRREIEELPIQYYVTLKNDGHVFSSGVSMENLSKLIAGNYYRTFLDLILYKTNIGGTLSFYRGFKDIDYDVSTAYFELYNEGVMEQKLTTKIDNALGEETNYNLNSMDLRYSLPYDRIDFVVVHKHKTTSDTQEIRETVWQEK